MSYWEDRIKDYKKWAEKHEDDLMKRLTKIYKNEARKLETQIASYYAKYGENNVIEYRNMMQKLSDDDIALLIEKMDDFALRYPQYAHLMPVRESIYKLNRLEGLQYYVKMQQNEIGAINHAEMQKYFEQSVLKGSNIAMETMGFGKNFYKADSNIIKEFVGLNWANGKNFSTSIWENTTKLAQYLTTDIAQGMARGDSYDKLAKLLRERFEKVSRNDAKRLIFTEGTYIMAESTMQPFKEDFEYYRVSTVQDKKVCPICKEVAKKTFEISERQPGVNFPPLHPWCRCSFEIVVDDWDKWMTDYEEKHGSDAEKANSIKKKIENNPDNIYNKDEENKNNVFDIKQGTQKLKDAMGDENYETYASMLNKNSDIKNIYVKYADKIKNVKYKKNGGVYNPLLNTLEFGYEHGRYDGINMFSTLAHEYGHFFDAKAKFKVNYKEIDALNNHLPKGMFDRVPSSSDEFLNALREDKKLIKSIWSKETKEDLISNHASHGVQDVITGMFKGSGMRWQHEESYWNRKYNELNLKVGRLKVYDLRKDVQKVYKELGFDVSNQQKVASLVRNYETASEAWANVMSAIVCEGKELEYVKKYLPNMYKTMIELLKGVE